MISDVLAWLETHESAISAVVGIVVLLGGIGGWLSSLRRGKRRAQSHSDEAVASGSKQDGSTITASDLTIAILPVVHTENDALLERFATGLARDLETFLARSSFVEVVATNTTALTTAERLAEVARHGVHYAFNANVRRVGAQFRVSAQLLDVATSHHLWSESFDRPFVEIETVGDDLAYSISNQLVVPVLESEGRRVLDVAVDTLDSATLARLAYGKFLFGSRHDETSFGETRTLLDRAIELDPNNARALATRAASTATAIAFGLSEDPEGDEKLAYRDSEAALHIAPTDSLVLWGRAWPTAFFEGFAVGLPFIEKAVAADPNDPHLRVDYAQMLGQNGRTEEARPQIEAAFRLSPKDPRQYIWYGVLAYIELQEGDIEGALAHCELSISFAQYSPAYMLKIIIHVLREEEDEARRTIEQLAQNVSWKDPAEHFRDFMARFVPEGPHRSRLYALADPWPQHAAGNPSKRERAGKPSTALEGVFGSERE